MKPHWLILLFSFLVNVIFGPLSTITVYAADVTPMVAVSNSNMVVLKADGTVWSWGQGASGEAGDGRTHEILFSPMQASINDVKFIAIGNSNVYAIKIDGTLWAWGFNGNGELGVGDKNTRMEPVQIPGLSDIIQVAGSNGGFAVCLKSDGSVYAWGDNSYGQLGNGSKTGSTLPVQCGTYVKDFNDIRAIDVGGNHVVARKGDGTVWTWGRNDNKQCGRAAQTLYTTPGQVTDSGIENILKITAGSSHTVVLKNDGTVWAWGSNQHAQLGRNSYDVNTDYWAKKSYYRAQIQGLSGIRDINAGYGHTMVQKSDGSVWSVGMNFRGEAADGQYLGGDIPYTNPNFRQALVTGALMQIESFAFNTAFLKTDGSVWTCGANSVGQVGNGTTSLYVDVPSKVLGLNLIADEVLTGDVDGNSSLNLMDVLSVLRVFSETSVPSLRTGADVNSDDRIGLAEAVYVLQKLGSARGE